MSSTIASQVLYETGDTPYEVACRRLAELEALYAKRDAIHADRAADIAIAVPDEVKRKLEAIDLEYAERIQDTLFLIQATEKLVKETVVALGKSVKSATLQAVYAGGRVSWDDKMLSGYAAAHPEIKAMRKVGEPYVTIRGIK